MKLLRFLLLLACSAGVIAAETQDGAAADYAKGVALKERDPVAARQAFERADQEGHLLAAVQLGTLYASGAGVTRDDSRALIYFEKASASGQREALYNKGLFCLEGRGTARDLNCALESLEAAAAAGSSHAHIKLADTYYFGIEGLQKDYSRALPHVKKAAITGDAWACNILGTMAELGQAMKVDLSAARHWFGVAAAQGHAKAQGNLGRILRNGHPTSAEKVECYKWLKLSSMQGVAMATYQLSVHSRSMSPAQIAEGEREVMMFKENRNIKSAPSLPPPAPERL